MDPKDKVTIGNETKSINVFKVSRFVLFNYCEQKVFRTPTCIQKFIKWVRGLNGRWSGISPKLDQWNQSFKVCFIQ